MANEKIEEIKKKTTLLEKQILEGHKKSLILTKKAISLEDKLNTLLSTHLAIEKAKIAKAKSESKAVEKKLVAKINALKIKRKDYEKKREMLKLVKDKTAKIKAELSSLESNIRKETADLYKIEVFKKTIVKKPIPTAKSKPFVKSKPFEKPTPVIKPKEARPKPVSKPGKKKEPKDKGLFWKDAPDKMEEAKEAEEWLAKEEESVAEEKPKKPEEEIKEEILKPFESIEKPEPIVKKPESLVKEEPLKKEGVNDLPEEKPVSEKPPKLWKAITPKNSESEENSEKKEFEPLPFLNEKEESEKKPPWATFEEKPTARDSGAEEEGVETGKGVGKEESSGLKKKEKREPDS